MRMWVGAFGKVADALWSCVDNTTSACGMSIKELVSGFTKLMSSAASS